MNDPFIRREDLETLAAALHELRAGLLRDLAYARTVSAIADGIDLDREQRRHRDIHAEAEALIRRIRELRDAIDVHVHTMNRLRARMHQLRGGARPH